MLLVFECASFTIHLCLLSSDEDGLCAYRWAVSGCCDKVKCTLLTHATWHTSHKWPQSVINQTLPEVTSRQTQLRLSLTKSWARSRSTETCLFSLLEPCKAVFLYQPTHIYWNNKPQSSTCTRLPQLTVIFMFTPLKVEPQWAQCQLAKMDQLLGMRKDRECVLQREVPDSL